ncbi:PAS domain-containing protein [Pedobacter sp. MC2016-05]|uniref:ATP-binding protein n=1 Tax=Pedobacter sp. MC2016-05 TaxID=2994474 RepID=UPI002245AA27|nr:PAS domain-containing protein [Pedobacter sp. MC2016-05]MCX2477252.1 PAS domain-containing protein [Pedobacter sp. MC2016-05]
MSINHASDLPISGNDPANIKLLKSALDSSISGIIITDNTQFDNPIIYCNKAFEVLSGYLREEVIGRNCRFLQGNERNQQAREDIRKAVTEGESITVELRNYRKGGELFWNELYISPILGEAGQVTHFIGVQNDITRRKNAEENLQHEREQVELKIEKRTRELNENREYLDSIIQTIRQGLIVLDPEYKVISANDFFLKTFKVENRDTIGRSLYDLGNGQWDIKQLRVLLEQILPTNNPVLDFEVDHEFPHIGRKLMLLNAHRIEIEGSFKDRILIAIEDITQIRASENRKDDFLSVSSHELKTPLTTIKGYNQTILRLLPADINPKIPMMVNKSGKQIDRLQNIITSLLEMSRIQSGKLVLDADSIDMNILIKEMLEEAQEGNPEHILIFEGQTNHTIPADESQISQVLQNLITNAIKYSPDSRKIKLMLTEVSNYIKVSITDYGFGISQEDQKMIFDRFFRVSTIQKHFPGMGIGLYICAQIIKQHGGTLWVDSEPGKGATFSFTLPIKAKESGDE